MQYLGVGILIVVIVAVSFLIKMRRHRRDYRELLEPILLAHHLQFVSASWPGFFKTGPFPRIGIEAGRPQSQRMGIRGEYDVYRVISVRDDDGKLYTLWACIEFEVFKLRRVRWRIPENGDVPRAFHALIEG